MRNLWLDLTKALQARMSDALFKLWMAPIQAEEGQDGKLILSCPNRFFASWIREHYLQLIQDELRGLAGAPVEVVVGVSPRPVAGTEPGGEDRQLVLPHVAPRRPVRLNREFTFEEFVVGNCNSFAYQAAMAMATGTCGMVNTVYLLSGTGLGKSHLAQAVGNHVAGARPGMRVIYATAEEFTNEMIAAIRSGHTQEFKEKWRRCCDMLLLEEVQFLAGKEKTQAELAFTLDALGSDGKKIVFTGSCLPRDIPRMGSGLRSRLSSALITSIEAPDYATRTTILRKKAARRGLLLPEDVAGYMAENLSGDVRQLEGAVVGLAAKSSLAGRLIDLALAREVVGSFLGVRRPVTIDLVQDVVGQYYRLSREELQSRSRKRQIVQPRNLAMYLCRQHTRESLEAIGRAFSRDHATVLYACHAVEREIKKNGPLGRQMKFLSQRLVSGEEGGEEGGREPRQADSKNPRVRLRCIPH
ncbi:MAG: chromosomal replication initiator protein DnaA [Pseudomonadota bacterium]